MNVTGTLQILLKRWMLTLPLLVLALVGAGVLAMRPGPYQTESQVVLIPSQTIAKANGNNPFLAFENSISLAADLLRRELIDPATAQALAAQGYTSSYDVSDDPNTSGPVLDITVSGRDKASVQHTLYGVTAEAGTKLAAMQTGLGSKNQITSLTVYLDATPTTLTTKKARTPLIVFGLGLVLTLAIPQAVDAAIGRRRGRPAAAGHPSYGPYAAGPDPYRRPADREPAVREPAVREPVAREPEVASPSANGAASYANGANGNGYAAEASGETTTEFARITDPEQD
jgi:hypothetical protein